MPHLPELRRREALALLDHLGIGYRVGRSGSIVGRTRAGAPFTLHAHDSEAMFRAKVAKFLKQAGITEAEFWIWYNGTS